MAGLCSLLICSTIYLSLLRIKNVLALKVYFGSSFVFYLYYYFSQKHLIPFSSRFDAFFFLSGVAFLMGYLGVCGIRKNLKQKKVRKIRYIYIKVFSIYVAVLSIVLFVNSLLCYNLAQIRSMIVSGELSYYIAISFPVNCVCLFYETIKEVNLKYRLITIVIVVLLAAISSSKMFLILSIFYIIPWYDGKNKPRPFQTIVIVLFFGLIAIFMNIVTGRVVNDPSGSAVNNVIVTTRGYALGGVAAFNAHLDGYYDLNKDADGWIKTGEWYGNVISAYYTLYKKYSISNLIAGMVILGAVYSLLDKAKSKNWLFMKVYAFFPLVFIPYMDFYTTGGLQWLCFFLASLVLKYIK